MVMETIQNLLVLLSKDSLFVSFRMNQQVCRMAIKVMEHNEMGQRLRVAAENS